MYPDGFDPKYITIGLNSTKKAIKSGTAKRVFLACDAEDTIRAAVLELSREQGVLVDEGCDMAQLGAFCGIDVMCAVCAVLIH